MHKSTCRTRRILRIFIFHLIFSLLFTGSALSADNHRFIDNGNATVTDNKTGLMWAATDNGADIDFFDAESYCQTFSAGGYSDWRLPDIKELKDLYSINAKKTAAFGITSKIKLSSCCPWSSYYSTGVSSLIDFRTGKEIWSFKGDKEQLRVLPVRGEEK